MPIRKKLMGLRRGRKGFMFRIPTDEVEKISKEDIDKALKEVYGTSEVEMYTGNERSPYRRFSDYFRQIKFEKEFNILKPSRQIVNLKYSGTDPNLQEEFRKNLRLSSLEIINDGKYLTFRPTGIDIHGITGREFESDSWGRNLPFLYKVRYKKKFGTNPPRALSGDYSGRKLKRDSYADLISILATGFRKIGGSWEQDFSSNSEDRDPDRRDAANNPFATKPLKEKKRRLSIGAGFRTWAKPSEMRGVTRGDGYTIEFMPVYGSHGYVAEYAPRENILGVNIEIDPEATPEKREEKMQFYREQISKKYHIPVRFYLRDLKSARDVEEKVIMKGRRSFIDI